ncbi:MAG TPA: FAD-dependent oxidoreductase [Steroidobacteraceae bacterium]|jgi:dimethylglycine dehydrogenase|nr:FAD-dependent oxidoreductase [Steroidobacteraceae bacterium]
MKDSARAVIIGGGVVGASVLYHLAKIGWTDVLLLEKSELTSGSTWHAAGGMHTFNGEANISRLQKYTIDLYREIEAVSGQSCGLHPNGGLMLAATAGELDSLRLICSRARYLGMETEMISLSEAQNLNPLIDASYFIGALWRADGGHCDPSGTTNAYVKAARTLGASVERFTRVLSLAQRRDNSWEVVTDKGTVHAEHVVNCAGLWAREVGHMVGIELPVLAMEHHYLITEDIPELEGRPQEIVNTTDYDGEIYLRQERRGVLIGTYEPHGVVWSPVQTPDDFAMQLLPEDFERLAPYFEVGFRHFPALGRVGIRKAVNGPFTFAPDGNPLVGPVRGVRNYWVACAVMAGFSQGGGIGLMLSRWMAENDPGQDIISMDVARFGAFATPKYTSVKVPENYARRFRLTYPNEELPAGRPVRRSPIYDRLIAAGGVMGANFGLENALWFAPAGVPPTETPTYRRSEAFPFVRAECQAVRGSVGLYETTNYGKYEVTGRGARAWLDRVFACRIPRPGRLGLAPMLNSAGRIMGDLSIACLAEDRFLIVGSGFAEEFHLRWFWATQPPADVCVRSVASQLTGVSIAGPRARELVQRLVRVDLSPQAFRLFQVAETAVGFAPSILTRAGFTGELGYEIWTTPDYFVSLYDELWDAGRALGLVHFGGRALSSLRLEKGYGSFNKDFRPDYTPGETGLDRFVDFNKPEFTGRSAALAERAAGPKRRFVVMEVADTVAEVIGYESIMKDAAAVGYVTSGAYGHCVDRSLAAGYVPASLAREGARFEIDILGEMRTATVHLTPLYDPQGARLRG